MAHNYDIGTRAWQPDAVDGWVASEVVLKDVKRDRVKLVFRLESEEVCLPLKLSTGCISHGICLRQLTFWTSGEDYRNHFSGFTSWQQCFVAPLNEPRCARSQR